jgi:hypothetical protein
LFILRRPLLMMTQARAANPTLTYYTALKHNLAYASAPRAFLLALTCLAPPYALLVAYRDSDGQKWTSSTEHQKSQM